MMLYASSCERPSKSSASVFLPSSVSNSYSLSTGTHGSERRCSTTFSPSSACSASSFASSSRACRHSSRVPILCSDILRLLRPFATVRYDRRGAPDSSRYTYRTRHVYDWCMTRVRTNIEIDEDFVEAIMDRYGVRTKTAAVDLALRHLAGQPMTRREAMAMRGARAIDEPPVDA